MIGKLYDVTEGEVKLKGGGGRRGRWWEERGGGGRREEVEGMRWRRGEEMEGEGKGGGGGGEN